MEMIDKRINWCERNNIIVIQHLLDLFSVSVLTWLRITNLFILKKNYPTNLSIDFRILLLYIVITMRVGLSRPV